MVEKFYRFLPSNGSCERQIGADSFDEAKEMVNEFGLGSGWLSTDTPNEFTFVRAASGETK